MSIKKKVSMTADAGRTPNTDPEEIFKALEEGRNELSKRISERIKAEAAKNPEAVKSWRATVEKMVDDGHLPESFRPSKRVNATEPSASYER